MKPTTFKNGQDAVLRTRVKAKRGCTWVVWKDAQGLWWSCMVDQEVLDQLRDHYKVRIIEAFTGRVLTLTGLEASRYFERNSTHAETCPATL